MKASLVTVPLAEIEAKLIDYRGHKVAGFDIDGETLICLPQTYELFLKVRFLNYLLLRFQNN